MVMDKLTDEGHSSREGGWKQKSRLIFSPIQAHLSLPAPLPPLLYPSPFFPAPGTVPFPALPSLCLSDSSHWKCCFLFMHQNRPHFSKPCSNPTRIRKDFQTNLHHSNCPPFPTFPCVFAWNLELARFLLVVSDRNSALNMANGKKEKRKQKDELLASRTDFRTLILWLNPGDLMISLELFLCLILLSSMPASFSESLSSFAGKDGCRQLWITLILLESPLE